MIQTYVYIQLLLLYIGVWATPLFINTYYVDKTCRERMRRLSAVIR